MPEAERDTARIEAFARTRRLQPDLVARWRSAAAADAEALLELAESLRLSENQLRGFFDWAEEIAVREGTSVAAVLSDAAVRSARERARSRNEAVHAVRAALRRRRYPQLARAEERLRALVRALGLPPGTRFEFPADLQGSEVSVILRAADAEALRVAAARLWEAAQRSEVEEIFAVLREAP